MQKVALATLTFARTPQERIETIRTLAALDRLGLSGICGDEAKSKYPIIGLAKKLKNIKIIQVAGLDKRIRLILNQASQRGEFIFYLEGDKHLFVKNNFKPFLSNFLKNPKGIYLPARTPSSFKQYPKFQQTIEIAINSVIGEIVDMKGDYCYGPRLFPSKLVPYFRKVDQELNFGFQSFLVVLGHRLGLPLKFVYSKLSAPKDVQVGKDLKIYRLQTLEWYLQGIEQALEIKLPPTLSVELPTRTSSF